MIIFLCQLIDTGQHSRFYARVAWRDSHHLTQLGFKLTVSQTALLHICSVKRRMPLRLCLVVARLTSASRLALAFAGFAGTATIIGIHEVSKVTRISSPIEKLT